MAIEPEPLRNTALQNLIDGASNAAATSNAKWTAIDQMAIALDETGRLGVAAALFIIMLGVAMGLRLQDFRFLKTAPRLFFGGVFAQILLLPLATLLLIGLIKPPPSVALGMIVVAACPGGTSSNMLTLFARGDLAYSVALTATSSALAAFVTPLAIVFWSGLYAPTAALLDQIDMDTGAFVLQTTALLAVPLAIGMTLRARAEALALRLRRPTATIGASLLGLVIAYSVIESWSLFSQILPLVFPIAAAHNAIALLVGALAGRIVAAPAAARRTLVFEVGIQNSGLAIVILLSQMQGLGGAAAMAAVWGVWHLIAGGLIVLMFRGIDARAKSSAAP
ncbi:MAG: bile acid:sodium symporter [Pseudomonadota bacterium]